MHKTKRLVFHILSFLSCQLTFAQVDVVYNDLVWQDEFDTEGPANSANWFHQTQLPNGDSWFNGELQHYTNLPANAFVTGGLLNIVARKQNYTDQGVTKAYTSARLNAKFAFRYGRVDVRAKLPVQSGTWPAIWMLGKNVNEDGGYFDADYGNTNWPACGEIDIMEHGIFSWQPVDYVQSTLHTPSSNGNSVNHGGTMAANLQQDFHVYSMNWSPFEISFLLDGEVYYTYNPEIKNAQTWPFDNEQYLLLNLAMGGIAGNISPNFNQAAMVVDYVRIYQNTAVDTQAPTNFTAEVGNVTSTSVELLLHAADNSGIVEYTIGYGANTVSVSAPSGTQQSVNIPNLFPGTAYTFTVSAQDMAGNEFADNPIVCNATTAAPTGCGTDTEAQQGVFSVGYNYTFETTGTDVTVTFELLDTDHVGVVGILWNQNPFSETNMTQVSGNTFTHTLTAQTVGSTINYAVKFAYAGGLAVTKYIPYVVGSNCLLGTILARDGAQFTFQNPARNSVHIQSARPVDAIAIYNLFGTLVAKATHTNEVAIGMLPAGIYLLAVTSGGQKSVKKLIVE